MDVWSGSTGASSEYTTTLAAWAADPEPHRQLPLVFEAFLYAGMAAAVGHWAGHEHAGIISVFLTTAGLSTRTKTLHRHLELQAGGRKVFAIARRPELLYVFSGVFCMYLFWVSLLGPAETLTRFDFAVRASGLSRASTLADGLMQVPAWGLMGHNLLVATSAFVLAFVYRTYGFLLVLTWNGAVWATSLHLLVHRAMEDSPFPPWVIVPGVALAVLPHLLLEATAYGVAGLAGTRAGVYLFRRMGAIRSSFSLGAAALGLTVLASALELTWPRILLAHLLPD